MKQVVKYLLVFLLWNVVAGAFLLFGDPLLGLPFALGLSALYVWGYLLRRPVGQSAPRRAAYVRFRPLSGSRLKWTLVAIPVLLVLAWAMGDLYTRLVPVPAESLNPFEGIMTTTGGRLAITVFAVGVAPLVEELVFRGLIQRTLEQRFGVGAGITLSAALFAFIHLLPWVFPLHFFLGLAFGFAVYATRSIWSGVILHAANNAAAMIGVVLTSGETETNPTLWEIGVTPELWLSILILLASGAVAVWTGRGLLDSGRSPRLRSA